MGKKGGGGRGGGGGTAADRLRQYFKAVEQEKLDTVRWALRHGGVALGARNPDSRTGLHLAAALGKGRSLSSLLDFLPRGGPEARELAAETLDCVDDEGRTPLMMACHRGDYRCAELLFGAGARADLKDARGKTARDYALAKKEQDIVNMLDGVESEEEEEEDAGAPAKKSFLKRMGKAGRQAKREEEEAKADAGSAEHSGGAGGGGEAAAASPAPEAQWPEVAEIQGSSKKEVAISRDGPVAGGGADPALWSCTSLNMLTLKCGLANVDGVRGLRGLLTLILTGNELAALPEEIGELKLLKNLEVDDNYLKALPAAVGGLPALESLSVNGNQLTSLAPLQAATALVSLHAARNALSEIDCGLTNKPRLSVINVSDNGIEELPGEIGGLQLLRSLNVSDNEIEELPCELGELKESKLKELGLGGNPWDDGKIVKMIQKSNNLSKEILTYVRKQKGKGKKGKGKGKKGKKLEDAMEEVSIGAEEGG